MTAEFYSALPTKRIGAGVLFSDVSGRVLLVEPTYKDTWEIPGGLVEAGESPLTAARSTSSTAFAPPSRGRLPP